MYCLFYEQNIRTLLEIGWIDADSWLTVNRPDRCRNKENYLSHMA